jgi:hypothetical protein
MTFINMKKLLFIILLVILSACGRYVTIDQTMNELTPPVTLVSRSEPNINGTRLYKVRDGHGRTYTCRDNSLNSIRPGSTIVPATKPLFKDIDKVLMKLKSPVLVIGKYDKVLKVKDRKGKIITIEDITLKDYEIGDTIK